MASAALRQWRGASAQLLDRFDAAHAAIGGPQRGRRFALDHVTRAYATSVASQFQRFCRDLHSTSIDALAGWATPQTTLELIFRDLGRARRIDSGNAQPASITEDFLRFGIHIKEVVERANAQNRRRFERLQELNDWRNAIVHHDFRRIPDRYLRLGSVRRWRSSCNGLAKAMDRAMTRHLATVVDGTRGDMIKPAVMVMSAARSVPRPGTRVRVQMGPYVMNGTVLEDRGNLGAGGRRLVRVSVPVDANVVAEYEVPLDQIKPIASRVRRRR